LQQHIEIMFGLVAKTDGTVFKLQVDVYFNPTRSYYGHRQKLRQMHILLGRSNY